MGLGDMMKRQMLKQFLPDVLENLDLVDEFILEYLSKVNLNEGDKYSGVLILPSANKKAVIHTVVFSANDQVNRIVNSQTVGNFAKSIVELETKKG